MKSLIIFVFALFLFANCEKPEECVEYKSAKVLGIQGPTNAVVGENVTFDVQMELTDDCGEFDRFVTVKSGTFGGATEMKAAARHTGCNCSGKKVVRTSFSMKWVSTSSNASIKFINEGENSNVIHDIIISDN